MPSPAATPGPVADRPQVWLQGLVVALLTAGCFLPTEGAVQGDTLWLACLWMAAASVAGFLARGTSNLPTWCLADAGVALFVGGHILSGCLALASGPDRYTASILLVEWVGLAAAWFALRTAFAGPGLPDQVLSIGVLIAVTLSLYGVWQFAVLYPSLAAEYGPKMELVRTLGPDSPEAARAVQELHAAGVQVEGSALILFEKRLRDSREPFGLFALANTFGGFLAVWTLVGIGLWREIWRTAWWKQSLLVVLIALIAICLWLTNSRTAWAGLAVSLTGMLASSLRRKPGCGWLPRLWALGTGAVSVGVVLYGILGDWQNTALPGPLKSLVYRFQYWRGTWSFLQDDWLLGSGLGQFRGHYVAHKLPEASEDIADPHNLWLDAWSNGGLIALIGLAVFLLAVVRPIWNRAADDAPPLPLSKHPAWDSILVGGAAAGMTLAFLEPFLFLSQWNDSPLVLTFVWSSLMGATTVAGVVPIAVRPSAKRNISALAAVLLGFHLVGAGGIGLPTVVQTLFLLAVATLPPSQNGAPTGIAIGRQWAIGGGFVLCACFALGFVAIPVQSARIHLDAGDRSVNQGRRDFAGRAYHEATAAAPLWLEPWLRIASLEEQAWKAADRRDDAAFDASVAALDAAWRRYHGSYLIARQAARLWTERAAATAAAEDRQQAVDWVQRAVSASPTNALLQADLALAQSAAGDQTAAAEAARRALAQQQINEEQGHVDRYLPPELLIRLATLVAGQESLNSPP